MTTRILVAFSSRHGATDELAHMIGSTIAESGPVVDVRRMEDIGTVLPYDALVLGSAVYMGRWTSEACRFVELHADGIATRPTWLFSSGPIGDSTGAEPFDAAALVRETGARDHHLFGGRLVKRTLGLRERAFARLLRVEDGDYREWATAAAWATAIARTMANEQAA